MKKTCVVVAEDVAGESTVTLEDSVAGPEVSDIPERATLKGLTATREKVECMLRIRQERKKLTGKITKSA